MHPPQRGRFSSPIGRVDPGKSYKENLTIFWKSAGKDLADNFALLVPFFACMVLYVLLSTWGFMKAEQWPFSQSIYMDWMTITTIGYDDKHPLTWVGKLIASSNAFVGIVFMGVIVWLVTVSLNKTAPEQ